MELFYQLDMDIEEAIDKYTNVSHNAVKKANQIIV